MTIRKLTLFAALVCFGFCQTLNGDILLFTDGDTFDGDQATGLSDSTDQAGPFALSVGNRTLTTLLINGVDASTESNRLETTNGKLGIDSASASGGEKNSWNDGESWTYEWDGDTLFHGIRFGGFSSGEFFSVQSSAFIGFNPVGALGSGVSLNSVTGTWTFDGAADNDDIDISDLGGTGIVVSAFEDITISYSGSSPSTLQGISSVPEPTSLLMVGMAFGFVTVTRRRRTQQS